MSAVINISATKARQNFFQILNQVIDDGASFVISKKNSKKRVLIKSLAKEKKSKNDAIDLDQLYGSLKTKKRVKNETTLAHKLYAESQAKKYR